MLCGLIACCISGFVMTNRFGNIVHAVQCGYERMYYDSQFGQLKDTFPKWEGLQINSLKLEESKKLIDDIKINTPQEISSYFSFDTNWINDTYFFDDDENMGKFKGKYYEPYVNSMKDLLSKCREKGENIYTDDNRLFYNREKPDDTSSVVGEFIYEVNKIINKIVNKYDDIEDSLSYLYFYGSVSSNKLDKTITEFKKASEDLKVYQNGYLDKVEYYIKVSKACGYILVMIYLCILCAIAFIGCALLMAYSYLKDQLHLDIIMHIIWNLVKFFIFSFFMYGAAFGMLFLGLRDIISYNMYLFGEENLNSTSKTYLLPKKESKEFLRTCLFGEKNEYFGELDNVIYDNLNEFYKNYGELKNLLKNNNIVNQYYNNTFRVNIQYDSLRNLDYFDTSSTDYSDLDTSFSETDNINQTEEFDLSLIEPFENQMEMIKQINSTFSNFQNLSIEEYDYNDNFIDSFNCGFLKSDLAILYNTLYDLSIESRILCALSCCIGFIGEISIYFYLLSIYHYDKNEFKDDGGNYSNIKKKRRERIVDISSRNEFLSKKKPIDMKKFNKKLDLEFPD